MGITITLEDLRQYIALKGAIFALEEQINTMYYPVGSPPTDKDGSRSSTPGDPTAQAVYHIDDLRKRQEQKLQEYIEKTRAIEEFVESIDDHNVASIIRLHYIVGKSWNATYKIVYNSRYGYGDVCRTAVKRWFKQQK